jgi:hypothetical protein
VESAEGFGEAFVVAVAELAATAPSKTPPAATTPTVPAIRFFIPFTILLWLVISSVNRTARTGRSAPAFQGHVHSQRRTFG